MLYLMIFVKIPLLSRYHLAESPFKGFPSRRSDFYPCHS